MAPELTLAALEEVALHVLNPAELAKEQELCPQVLAHRKGQLPANVEVGFVNMSGVNIFCEISDIQNPRPMVPNTLRNLVCNLLHHADHPGRKESLRRRLTILCKLGDLKHTLFRTKVVIVRRSP